MLFIDIPNFSLKDTLDNGQGKVAKVIILAGQSNASGFSKDEYLKNNISKEKYQEYENGYDNVYINYFITNRKMSSGFVKCRNNQGEPGGHFGPELGLAEELSKQYPDQMFFIIKYAWSATTLCKHWLSPSSSYLPGKLYNQLIKFVNCNIDYLISKDYKVIVEGMCWMQGESDSYSLENSNNYEQNLINFIYDIRNEFKEHASYNGIAFIDAHIAINPRWTHNEIINASKDHVANMSYINDVINTNQEGLTFSTEPDTAHYDSLSQIKLGNLFAQHLMKYIDK